MHQGFKAAMDEYRDFFENYISFYKSINTNDPDYITKYASLMKEYIEVAETLEYLETLENEKLTKDEEAYIVYIVTDINAKLLAIIGGK